MLFKVLLLYQFVCVRAVNHNCLTGGFNTAVDLVELGCVIVVIGRVV